MADLEVLAERVDRQRRADQLGQAEGEELEVSEVLHPDQDFSIVDRTSFAVMQRLGLRRVASFDDDFAVFRFGRGRRQAFDVLR